MKRISLPTLFYIFLFALLTLTTSAQEMPKVYWYNTFGNNFDDYITTSNIDNKGNVYIAGLFRDTIDFDFGPGTHLLHSGGTNWNHIFFCKYDSLNQLIWAYKMGTPSGNYDAYDIQFDKDNNIYFAGKFSDVSGMPFDADPTAGTHYIYANGATVTSFITKLDENGNFLGALNWERVSNSTTPSNFKLDHLRIDTAGFLYITGQYEGNMDLNPDPWITTSTTNSGMLIAKYNSVDFDFEWHKAFEFFNSSPDMEINAQGQIYLSGAINNTIDLDPGSGQFKFSTQKDLYIAKYSNLGNFITAKAIDNVVRGRMKLDNQGNVYITGANKGILDIDFSSNVTNLPNPVVTNAYSYGFLVKYDHNLNLLKYKSFNTISIGFLNASEILNLSINDQSEVYVYGRFNGKSGFLNQRKFYDLDTCYSIYRYFLLKIDSNFSPIWGRGIKNISSKSEFSHNNGRTLFSSKFYLPLEMSLTSTKDLRTPVGGYDACAVYFTDCRPGITMDTLIACYSLDFKDDFIGEVDESGIYSITYPTSSSCDSLYLVNLKVHPHKLDVYQNGSFFTVFPNNLTYTWIDCATDSVIKTDTINLFYAAEFGNYKVAIEYNDCPDTSACMEVNYIHLEQSDFPQLRYYPNPTSGQLTIDFGSKQFEGQIFLFNITGQVISQFTSTDSSEIQINIPGPAGLYLVQIRSHDGRFQLLKISKF